MPFRTPQAAEAALRGLPGWGGIPTRSWGGGGPRSSSLRPGGPDHRGKVALARAVFFIYGERGQLEEKPANEAFYAAAGRPKVIWEVPGAEHIGGFDAQPQENEQRIIAFFDTHLPSNR
jgi:uncharacterized protein